MGRYMKSQQQKFYEGFDQSAGNSKSKIEGEVEIKQSRKKTKKEDNDLGEYIDFEDVDD